MRLLNWLQRYHLRSALHNALWPLPLAAVVAALLVAPQVRALDAATRWTLFAFTPDGARAVLGILVGSMLTFIVFIFSFLLVAVQIASGTLTPRIIAGAFRDPALRACLALFVFAFVYGTAVLGRIVDPVPQLPVMVAIVFSLASVGSFLYLIDHMGRQLRPVTVLSSVAGEGARVLAEVYPQPFSGAEHRESDPLAGQVPARVVLASRSGVVLAFDLAGLAQMAAAADGAVELVPQVGDFVASGGPLYRLYGGTAGIEDRRLSGALALGGERTLEQDPLFAFRVIVDVAAKALSPAINDPTTGVLALDQLHRLLTHVGWRRLDTGVVRDAGGRLRVLYRTPDWADFVHLAVTEIRLYGTGSPQVARRLRAMLVNLIELLPEARREPLRRELALLDRVVERGFADAEDRTLASREDTQGMGSPTRRLS